jgi:hypothetical protein
MACETDAALSPVYREALRLQADGEDDEAIAEALELTVEAVPALLLLAARKQARAGADQSDDA